MDFDEKQVWSIAKALGDGIRIKEYSNSINSWAKCIHCGREVVYNEDEEVITNFNHHINCVIITARDLLTGAK